MHHDPALPPDGRSEAFAEDLLDPPPAPQPALGGGVPWARLALALPLVVAMASVLLP